MGCTQSTPVQEPVAVAPASNVSAAPGSSQPAAVPTSNGSSASKNSSTDVAPPSAPGIKKFFTVTGVSITEQGIVYYHIEATDSSATLKKRFNDFKALYVRLANSSLLPPLPQSNLGTIFRGKHNQDLLKEREEQFEVIMNSIGNNAAFANDDAFKAFLA
uniref:PX domain-containing protein n=1 Tax=Globisporangium ultimum (strain ATCC 200006 / CBS 805.95 / DAOM BR144) TaxID=431595 RepID=K3XBQ3_GLOUD